MDILDRLVNRVVAAERVTGAAHTLLLVSEAEIDEVFADPEASAFVILANDGEHLLGRRLVLEDAA